MIEKKIEKNEYKQTMYVCIKTKVCKSSGGWAVVFRLYIMYHKYIIYINVNPQKTFQQSL